MKLHLPTSLRSALFARFAAVCTLGVSLASGTLVAYLAFSQPAYASYNSTTATFEGTNNGALNPTAATYSGVETLIFNMGTSGTGNHLSNASWIYAGNIQIGAVGATETGLCLNAGNRNQTDVFTGKVTGTGLLSKTGAGTNLTIAFEGDVTEFTGAIRLGSTAAFTLRFGGGSAAPANQSAVHGVSGTGDITFTGTDKDTLTYNYSTGSPVYITNRIITNAGATSKVALNGRAHYVLTKDAAISSLSLGAGNTLHIGTTGHSSATLLGALTMGAGAAVHVDNGSLEVLNATSLVGTYAIGTEGVLHLSRTAALEGSLTVAQGGALSIGALSGFSDVDGGLQTPAAGENGFAAMNGKLSILTGSADKLQALAGTTVLYEGKNLELAGDGTVTIAEVDHSAYYLRSGEKTLSSLVAESDNKLTRIEMGTGVKLAVDSGAVQGSYSVENERFVALNELGASTIVGDIRIDNLSATETIFVASGATLRIGSTAEGFSRDINLSADGHLVFDAEASTAMSVGRIINTADRKDDFRRSVYVGEQVSLQTSSFINSWGMESLTVDGELNISGTLSYETGGSRWGNSSLNNLIAGEGHITAGSLNISNASDYNTISVQKLTVTGATTISRSTTISGGTTEFLGSTTVSAALNLTGGHLILGDELGDTATLSGNINLSAGELTLNGTASLGSNLHQTGGTLTINGELVQTSTLTASGTLALNGTLKADSAALDTIGDITYSDGVNGYRQVTFVLVNKGEAALSLQRGADGAVLLDGADATSFLSTDASGNILLADTVGSVYHVFEGDAVYGGEAGTIDTDYTTGFGLHGGNLSLLAEREGGHHLELTADAYVTLGAGVSLSASSVAGAEHLTLSGAGTYEVNTLDEIAVVTRSDEWTGTTLINDRISKPRGAETVVRNSGNLLFRHQTFNAHVATDRGGAIYNNSGNYTLEANGVVCFTENAASYYGGAIYSSGTFSLNGNESVTFSANVSTNIGGGIYNAAYASFTLNGNESVSFSENQGSYGGGIYNAYSASFMLNGNEAVSFNKNTAFYQGGAIYSDGTFTLSGNESVNFSENTATSQDGGAIYCVGTFTLSENSDVNFSGNTARYGGAICNSSDNYTLESNGTVSFSENAASDGGAICTFGTFSLSGNENVCFSENTADNDGGAIAGAGTFTLRENSDVTFSANVSTGSGGAIYNNSGNYTLESNGTVSFSENASSNGGAIYSNGTFMLNGNKSVSFNKNTAFYMGGAIYSGGTFTLSGNENVSFSENTADNYGGAIAAHGTFTLRENSDVTFSANVATESGGAIYNYSGNYTLESNGTVSFRANTASSYGGAIYNSGIFTLEGNGDVVFEKNAEVKNGVYRLRSIYSNGGTLNLSASAGKSILFKDSIYASGTVNLNQNGTGDIIFSGASVEDDLRELKAGIDGTSTEIRNSLTSVLSTETKIYGGRLIVQDGAILKGNGITAVEGANASLVLHNSTLNETGYAVTISSGNCMEISGSNDMTSSVLDLQDGATLVFSDLSRESIGLSLKGKLQAGAISIVVDESVSSGQTLIKLQDVDESAHDGWNDEIITISNPDSASLIWRKGRLIYRNFSQGSITYGYNAEEVPDVEAVTEVVSGYRNATFRVDYTWGDHVPACYAPLVETAEDERFIVCGNDNVRVSGARRFAPKWEGGFINNAGFCSFADNGEILFEDMRYSSMVHGGSIYNSGVMNFTNNLSVSFAGEKDYNNCEVIYNTGTLRFEDNDKLTFVNNKTSIVSEGDVYFVKNDSVTFSQSQSSSLRQKSGSLNISHNRSVLFENGMGVGRDGLAIYCESLGTASIAYNENVSFINNGPLKNSGSTRYGAAIYNNGKIFIHDNSEVRFCDNHAIIPRWSDATCRGAAIANTGILSIYDNENVVFDNNVVCADYNRSTAYGGAIYHVPARVNNEFNPFWIGKNRNVIFSNNSANGNIGGAGGAIYAKERFEITGNENVSFLNNESSSAGGAIGHVGTYKANAPFQTTAFMALDENGNISFINNSSLRGGAIYNSQAVISFFDCGSVLFDGNTAYVESFAETTPFSFSFKSCGGAIYNTDHAVVMIDCDTTAFTHNIANDGGAVCQYDSSMDIYSDLVVFSDNRAYRYGGAICLMGEYYAQEDETLGCNVKINGTSEVVFSRNVSGMEGGAIFLSGSPYGTESKKSGYCALNVSADRVLFEKNLEATDFGYRLRSIYADQYSETTLAGNVIIRDSLYSAGSVAFAGNILFTGATTEADLAEMKGSPATREEISASLTSYISKVGLNGVLMIEDGAVLEVANLRGGDYSSVVINGGSLIVHDSFTLGALSINLGRATEFGGHLTITKNGMGGADAAHKLRLANASFAYEKVIDQLVSDTDLHDCSFDLAEGSTMRLSNVNLYGNTRFTDDPATMVLEGVSAELEVGVNVTLTTEEVMSAGTALVRLSDGNDILTLTKDSVVQCMEATTFDTVTLTGSSLVLELGGLNVELFNGADYVALSFTSGNAYATFESGLSVLLSSDGEHYAHGYYLQDGDNTSLFFDTRAAGLYTMPEPATVSLSLLALAALAARRKRR